MKTRPPFFSLRGGPLQGLKLHNRQHTTRVIFVEPYNVERDDWPRIQQRLGHNVQEQRCQKQGT
jgi:hypothetical protein